MSPQRLAQAEPAAVGIVAAVATAFGAIVSPLNAILSLVLVILVAIDVAVGVSAAYLEAPPGSDWFNWDRMRRGAVRKFILFMLVITCWAMDIAFASTVAPAFESWTPISKYGLAHGIVAQVTSIARNASLVRELRLFASFLMRRGDALVRGEEPPENRHYDREAVALERRLRTPDGRSFYDAAHERDERPEDPT